MKLDKNKTRINRSVLSLNHHIYQGIKIEVIIFNKQESIRRFNPGPQRWARLQFEFEKVTLNSDTSDKA